MNTLLIHKPITMQIFQYLSIKDIFTFASTCKTLYNDWIVKNVNVLKLKQKLFNHFKWNWLPSLTPEKLIGVFRKRLNERDELRICIGKCGKSVSYLKTTDMIGRICVKCYNWKAIQKDDYWKEDDQYPDVDYVREMKRLKRSTH